MVLVRRVANLCCHIIEAQTHNSTNMNQIINHHFTFQAPNPLDFDGFVNLLGYRTLELDSEETLLSALSRWDKNNSGLISEDRYV